MAVVSSLNLDFGIGMIAACWIAALSLELNKPSFVLPNLER